MRVNTLLKDVTHWHVVSSSRDEPATPDLECDVLTTRPTRLTRCVQTVPRLGHNIRRLSSNEPELKILECWRLCPKLYQLVSSGGCSNSSVCLLSFLGALFRSLCGPVELLDTRNGLLDELLSIMRHHKNVVDALDVDEERNANET
jgi:hypothetical protein